jgi:UDP-glucose 4-epimerase
MRVVVTGARGKVGAATIDRLLAAGHEVTSVDRAPAVFERAREVPYMQADLSDAGDAAAALAGQDAVVHAAAIAANGRNPPHVVYANNVTSTYNVIEAAERAGARRIVFLSSETVPGFSYPTQYFHAQYAPIDEQHPVRPQDAYGISKHHGELLMSAAAERNGLTGVSLRPSWIQWEGNAERNVGPIVRARGDDKSASFWSYLIVYDLAELIARALTAELDGHEILYAAAADNANGLDTRQLIRRHFGDAVELRPFERPDASGISTRRARELLGWTAERSWREWLDDDGQVRDEVRDRVQAGATGVQRGLHAIS